MATKVADGLGGFGGVSDEASLKRLAEALAKQGKPASEEDSEPKAGGLLWPKSACCGAYLHRNKAGRQICEKCRQESYDRGF